MQFMATSPAAHALTTECAGGYLSAGDMVVEYIGHLVRPRVADLLEARTYNQLVGAGGRQHPQQQLVNLNSSYLMQTAAARHVPP